MILSSLILPIAALLCSTAPNHSEPASATSEERSSVTTQKSIGSFLQEPGYERRLRESLILRSDVEPSMTEEERAQLVEVIELVGNSENEAALAKLDEIITQTSTAQFEFMQGYVRYFVEDMEGSAEALNRAVLKAPTFLRAWQLYGQILLQLEEYARARIAISEAIRLGGASGDLYGALGFCYGSLGDHMSAESCYRMATVLDPVTDQWKEALALSFYYQGKYDDLVSYTGTLLLSQPDAVRLWDMQAKGYIRMEQPLRAAENYELVDMMGLSDFETLATLADIYVNESLFDLAVGAYTRAMAREGEGGPNRPLAAAKVMVANASYAEGMSLLASIELSYADQISDNQAKDIERLRALTGELTAQPEQQIAALKQILAIDPVDGQALLKLGQVFLMNSNYVESAIYFERAEGLEKYAARAKLGHAQALVGQEKFGEAVTLIRASLDLDDREPVRQYLKQIEQSASGGR